MEPNIKKALKKSTLFQGVGDEEYSNLISCLSPHVKHFAKNEIIIMTGESVTHIGVILSGTARAYTENISGSQTIMANLTPMSVFGEILVSTRTHKSPVTVYATSDVTAAFIDYQKVYSMCATACTAHRILITNILQAIGDKYFLLFDRINILREKRLRPRLKEYVYESSGRGEKTVVTIPDSKTMLANYLLVNRSALSKEFRKMEQDGIIAFYGRKVELLFCATKPPRRDS